MSNERLKAALTSIEELALDAECADPSDVIRFSIAISLKRIADALHRAPGDGLPTFLDQLHGVLSDASHDHAQRMS